MSNLTVRPETKEEKEARLEVLYTHKPFTSRDLIKPDDVKPMPDMVNHPPHYTASSVECIDALEATLGTDGFLAYCRGCAIKYLWRSPLKGSMLEDLKKAQWYINRIIAKLEAE